MKKIIPLSLALVLCISLAVPTFAIESPNNVAPSESETFDTSTTRKAINMNIYISGKVFNGVIK